MAAGDLTQILDLPLTPDGKLDLVTFNTIFRGQQERFFALEGRTQPSQIRNDLSVLGEVVATGDVEGASLSLGRSTLTPGDPSLAPLLNTSLTPQGLNVGLTVGANVDLFGPLSAFTMLTKDEFFGSGTASGTVGDLGWGLGVGTITSVSPAETAHPGGVTLSSGAGPAIGFVSLNPVMAADTVYLAAVVKVGQGGGRQYRFGLMVNPALTSETSEGFYFSHASGTSANWRTVTVSGANSTINTTDIPATVNTWFLLEMVVTIPPTSPTPSVDFYINRQRAFRHQDASVTNLSAQPAFAAESVGVARSMVLDRFVMAGYPRATVWT